MKKVFVIFVGLTIVLAWGGWALAQEKKPAEPAKVAEPAKPAEPGKPSEPAKPAEQAKPAEAKPEAAKPAEVKKEAPPKPVVYRMGGTVVALDAAAHKITIKQDSVKKQRKVALTVSKKAAKNLEGIKVGDVVNVWVTNKTVTNISKVF